MYGIFGEDETDFLTLKEIVRALKKDRRLPIRGEGFGGCGNLLKSCSIPLGLLYEAGCRRFIICVDADGRRHDDVRREVEDRVLRPAKLGADAVQFVAVPVQMIEAWILADVESANKLFTSWQPDEVKNPEAYPDPKHELERRSRQRVIRPRYIYTKHNAKIIEHLNLERVAKKCPSFRLLRDFIVGA